MNHTDVVRKLQAIMERLPRGLNFSPEDLALLGWLYLYERETGSGGIPDFQLKGILREASGRLELNAESMQLAQTVQRLMRLKVLRAAITGSTRWGYRLTSLGRSIAEHLIDDIDYGSEQLSVLLEFAFKEIEVVGPENGMALLQYLKHVFLGTIREKIEHKLLVIEEDLEERKKEVKRTYAGHNQRGFEDAIKDIEYCRMALTELVDAVQESSACASMEESLYERMRQSPQEDLQEVLEESVDFLYVLRGRIDAMLKDVVQFIRDCIAYRSLAFTVDSRDRLCRIQEKILSYALEHDIRMSILELPRLPRLDLKWSREERERPPVLDMDRLRMLESYRPREMPPVEPGWKEPLLELARMEWKELAEKGAVDLGEWINDLAESIPQVAESPHLAVWFLCQDWPRWKPAISVRHREGAWIPLGREWMMEAVRIRAAVQSPARRLPVRFHEAGKSDARAAKAEGESEI